MPSEETKYRWPKRDLSASTAATRARGELRRVHGTDVEPGHGRPRRHPLRPGQPAPDLACRWNCKAGKCGSCSAEVNGKPRLMCMTRIDDFPLDAADHRRADEDVPAHQGPGHRRLVELRGQQEDPAVQAAQADAPTAPGACSRRTSTASRSSASASSASCARTSATSCATTSTRSASRARASSSASRAWRCIRSTPRTALELLKDERGHRLLQHHQVLHRGLPRAHPHHRQRHHPAEGARRGPTTTTRSRGLAQAAGLLDLKRAGDLTTEPTRREPAGQI